MRWGIMLGSLLLAGIAATPANAARYTLARPLPCDRPIPTGRPIPRQGIIDAVGDVLMLGTVTPTWRDKPIGLAGKDERVTILQECGFSLRIRNVRGLEGWIHTVAISDERKAYEAAKNRPAETLADCEMLYVDPVTVDRCKIKLTAEQAHRDEVEHAPYMSAEELRHFVVGRTLTSMIRVVQPYDKPKPIYSFYAPDGEMFMMRGSNGDLRHRGRYELLGDRLCYPRENFCQKVRKVGGDLVTKVLFNREEYLVTGMDGDAFGAVAEVSKSKPNAVAPVIPQGAEDVAGPRL